MTEPRYDARAMADLGVRLLEGVGLDAGKALIMAEMLLEGDLLGHTTHGYQLLAPYLGALENGSMASSGEPEVINDTGPAVTWDGGYLPGPWLVHQGFELACERSAQYGLCGVSIRKSHHIACLASYLKKVTDRSMMGLVYTSDPAASGVAPFGGLSPTFTPDPIGIGIPTDGDPILIDISMSITTIGLTSRLRAEGSQFEHPWIQDNKGNATTDPSAFFDDPPGTVQPMGGKDHGHKGFSLALYVEAMTSGLNGYGRKDKPEGWGAAVFLQVYDPAAFGGHDEFLAETGWLAEACRSNPVPEGAPPVRLPGANGLKKRTDHMVNGVAFHPGIVEALVPWAEKFGVDMPPPLE